MLGSLALTATLLPLAAFGTVWALAAVLLAAGAAFAAVNVATYALLDAVAPEGAGAEALTWLTTAGAAGIAAGAAAGRRARGRGEPRAARSRCRRSGPRWLCCVAVARRRTLA